MSKVEQIIHEQYKEFTSNFRPEFGNKQHIYIVQEIGKLNKLEKEFALKIEAAKDLRELRDNIRKTKRSVLHLFKSV